MKREHGRVVPLPYVTGKVELPQQLYTTPLPAKTHRWQTLEYQQKVAALVECARDYAHQPSNPDTVHELLRVAKLFAENI